MKQILRWALSFNPLLPLMMVAFGVALMGQNISYDITIQ